MGFVLQTFVFVVCRKCTGSSAGKAVRRRWGLTPGLVRHRSDAFSPVVPNEGEKRNEHICELSLVWPSERWFSVVGGSKFRGARATCQLQQRQARSCSCRFCLVGFLSYLKRNWNPPKGETEKMERQPCMWPPDAGLLPFRQSTIAYCLPVLIFIYSFVIMNSHSIFRCNLASFTFTRCKCVMSHVWAERFMPVWSGD